MHQRIDHRQQYPPRVHRIATAETPIALLGVPDNHIQPTRGKTQWCVLALEYQSASPLAAEALEGSPPT